MKYLVHGPLYPQPHTDSPTYSYSKIPWNDWAQGALPANITSHLTSHNLAWCAVYSRCLLRAGAKPEPGTQVHLASLLSIAGPGGQGTGRCGELRSPHTFGSLGDKDQVGVQEKLGFGG